MGSPWIEVLEQVVFPELVEEKKRTDFRCSSRFKFRSLFADTQLIEWSDDWLTQNVLLHLHSLYLNVPCPSSPLLPLDPLYLPNIPGDRGVLPWLPLCPPAPPDAHDDPSALQWTIRPLRNPLYAMLVPLAGSLRTLEFHMGGPMHHYVLTGHIYRALLEGQWTSLERLVLPVVCQEYPSTPRQSTGCLRCVDTRVSSGAAVAGASGAGG